MTGGLVVSFSPATGLANVRPTPGPKTVSPGRVDGFLAIGADGGVVVYSGKVDLGTACAPRSHRWLPKSSMSRSTT